MPIQPLIIILLILIPLAVMFTLGKGTDFISGYSLKTESEKEKYDQLKLAHGMAKLLYFLIAFMILWSVFYYFGISANFYIVFGVLFILMIAANLYLLKSSKFRK